MVVTLFVQVVNSVVCVIVFAVLVTCGYSDCVLCKYLAQGSLSAVNGGCVLYTVDCGGACVCCMFLWYVERLFVSYFGVHLF